MDCWTKPIRLDQELKVTIHKMDPVWVLFPRMVKTLRDEKNSKKWNKCAVAASDKIRRRVTE
jgi:hypothetical protein